MPSPRPSAARFGVAPQVEIFTSQEANAARERARRTLRRRAVLRATRGLTKHTHVEEIMAKVNKDRRAKLQQTARGGAKSAPRGARAAPKTAKASARGAGRSAAKRAPGKAAAGARRGGAKKPAQPAPVPAGMHTVTPTLMLSDCAKAIDFYKEAFGAEERARFPAPDGKSIWHAEITIGDSVVYLNDPMDPSVKPPSPEAPSPVGIWLYVPDCDALVAQATKAGASVKMPVADMFWGDRMGALLDPFGVLWTVATHVKDMTEEEMRAGGEEFARKMAQGGAQHEGGGGPQAPAA
jgi:PhnB protein